MRFLHVTERWYERASIIPVKARKAYLAFTLHQDAFARPGINTTKLQIAFILWQWVAALHYDENSADIICRLYFV